MSWLVSPGGRGLRAVGRSANEVIERSWASIDAQLLSQIILVGTLYYGTALLGERSALVGHRVTPLWPPTGVALAAFLVLGRRVWPGVALAAYLVNAPVGHPFPSGILPAASLAAGDTLAPLLAYTLLHRVEFRIELDRLRDATAIVFLGALVAMSLSATWGTLTLVWSGSVPAEGFWPTWWVWWAGDAMGVLTVAPLLLSLRTLRRGRRASRPRRVEAAVLYPSLGLVAYAVFHVSVRPISYIVFPLLVWAAWRFGLRGAAPAALLTVVIADIAAVHGTGPFTDESMLQTMATLQVFIVSVAFTSLVLAAIVAERFADIAERRRAEEELEHLALHDPLTGLANRVLFMERLTQALARNERRPSSVAVLFLDLDRFKLVNDTMGHDVGDRVLASVAGRLRSVLRPVDTAARLGGDEFVVLCEDLEDERHVLTIAERIVGLVAEPIDLGSAEAQVSTSIGIALARGVGDRPEVLLRNADAAVYRAKDHGRARYELFDHDMRIRATKRLRVENELHRAIGAGELRLLFQPLVSLNDRRLVSVEALVRWAHPTRGMLLPDEFIPIAEESGFIGDLGLWVWREACRRSVKWEGILPDRSIEIAVNLSPRQLVRPDFRESVSDVLAETGADPWNFCFEITETALMDSTSPILETLGGLRELGIRLAIDDFGTGYSSLSHLRRFRVDMLKVDRSFVQGGPEDLSIVTAVVNLAHSLGMSAVGEGVETLQQSEKLRLLGCDLAQGYYFSRPQPAERIDELFLRSA
jgi:diguanylate cyclase (GGDEF)-like protein